MSTGPSYILEVKSYEKLQNKISYFSPNGEKNVIEYESYQNIFFAIFKSQENSYLALSNPPRSVRNFFNLLSNIAGIGYTIEAVNLNINSIAENFINKYQCDIKYVSIEKVSLNHRSYANLEVFSTENAIKDYENFTANSNYSINKVSLHIKNLLQNFDLTINKKGYLQTKCIDKSLSLNESDVFSFIHEILLYQN
ncbi:hypothetical protein F7P73_18405 [Acinetobacter bohemicus]|uniref:hypothetical protein n=1 Tax=Acinetobacter bohemicus TaxID=1435036 RepID=UPI001246DE99|nr:hypothetical protein [Acinetobacter bohemicus]KAB0649471.1 hypothetical protein F7P73_18405 [Acinetobacter bohemicus]